MEYYDSVQDEIAGYFTFKIQDVLATKRSLSMLLEHKKSVCNEGINSLIEESSVPCKTAPKKSQRKESVVRNELSKANVENDEEGESDREIEIYRKEMKKKNVGKVCYSVNKNH